LIQVFSVEWSQWKSQRLIHILNFCIFCCYIMTSMWWTCSLQPNQTRLWEDDVTGHVCESYIYYTEMRTEYDKRRRRLSTATRTASKDGFTCARLIYFIQLPNNTRPVVLVQFSHGNLFHQYIYIVGKMFFSSSARPTRLWS
jgi:hypothetical protein